jgi:hypothetical protein
VSKAARRRFVDKVRDIVGLVASIRTWIANWNE